MKNESRDEMVLLIKKAEFNLKGPSTALALTLIQAAGGIYDFQNFDQE
jgi:hypothetical protein